MKIPFWGKVFLIASSLAWLFLAGCAVYAIVGIINGRYEDR